MVSVGYVSAGDGQQAAVRMSKKTHIFCFWSLPQGRAAHLPREPKIVFFWNMPQIIYGIHGIPNMSLDELRSIP